jgi:hypothetical protein
MKNIILILLVILVYGCQREKANEVGVGYNKTLIIPPTNDLPMPGSSDNTQELKSDNSLVNSILKKSNADIADVSIIDTIDDKSGYKTDENFFKWIFKGKSQR